MLSELLTEVVSAVTDGPPQDVVFKDGKASRWVIDYAVPELLTWAQSAKGDDATEVLGLAISIRRGTLFVAPRPDRLEKWSYVIMRLEFLASECYAKVFEAAIKETRTAGEVVSQERMIESFKEASRRVDGELGAIESSLRRAAVLCGVLQKNKS